MTINHYDSRRLLKTSSSWNRQTLGCALNLKCSTIQPISSFFFPLSSRKKVLTRPVGPLISSLKFLELTNLTGWISNQDTIPHLPLPATMMVGSQLTIMVASGMITLHYPCLSEGSGLTHPANLKLLVHLCPPSQSDLSTYFKFDRTTCESRLSQTNQRRCNPVKTNHASPLFANTPSSSWSFRRELGQKW